MSTAHTDDAAYWACQTGLLMPFRPANFRAIYSLYTSGAVDPLFVPDHADGRMPTLNDMSVLLRFLLDDYGL